MSVDDSGDDSSKVVVALDVATSSAAPVLTLAVLTIVVYEEEFERFCRLWPSCVGIVSKAIIASDKGVRGKSRLGQAAHSRLRGMMN